MNKEKAIIDGFNAAYLQAPRERRPNIRNIVAVAEAVVSGGRDPVIIMDPSIRHLIPDDEELEKLLSEVCVTILPSGKDMNRFVLETAQELNAVIVSNNTYADHYEDFPWIEERRIPIAIVNQRVLLLDRLKRAS